MAATVRPRSDSMCTLQPPTQLAKQAGKKGVATGRQDEMVAAATCGTAIQNKLGRDVLRVARIQQGLTNRLPWPGGRQSTQLVETP